jgi:hypothetical protein
MNQPSEQDSWGKVPHKWRITAAIEKRLPAMDKIVGWTLTNALIAALAIFVIVLFFMGSNITVQFLVMGLSVIGGIAGAHFIYRSLEQEKRIQFFEGEQVLLESKSPSTYVVVVSLGDQDVPLEPFSANVYLTNLGILAERRNMGEMGLFIPLDMITNYAPHKNGIRIRTQDPRHGYMEALVFVDERDRWMSGIQEQINKIARIYR